MAGMVGPAPRRHSAPTQTCFPTTARTAVGIPHRNAVPYAPLSAVFEPGRATTAATRTLAIRSLSATSAHTAMSRGHDRPNADTLPNAPPRASPALSPSQRQKKGPTIVGPLD